MFSAAVKLSVIRQPSGLHNENRHRLRTSRFSSPSMRDASVAHYDSWKQEGVKGTIRTTRESAPNQEAPSRSESSSGLRFDRLQVDLESDARVHTRELGNFVARPALLDEEYWTAAWLRAESNWEDQSHSRYMDSYKKQFAEREFAALKRRCSGQHAEKCTCIVAVRKNAKQTVLKSIVGTLDISICSLRQGETFPGERERTSFNFNIYRTEKPKYGYISNVCVAKYARRQGIASNMLHLAIEAATTHGVEQIFVHVHRENVSAQKLYEKIGFKIVDTNVHRHSHKDCNYLMSFMT